MAPDPQVIQYAIDAAKRAGADPVVFLASGLVESGLRHDAVGDGGTSFGAFQWHRGGALGSNQPSWTRTPDAFFERARAFASLNARNGVGAAAAQRPADRAGYARKVDAAMAQAKRLMQGLGLSGVVQGNELGVGGAGTSASATPPVAADSTSGMLSQYEDSPFASLVSSNAKLAGLPGLKLPSVRREAPFGGAATEAAAPERLAGPQQSTAPPYAGGPKDHGARAYGNWQSDNAYDLLAPVGTPIYAVDSGTIGDRFGSLSSSNPKMAGLRLNLLGSRNNYYYAHLSRFAPGIKPGVRVKPGTLLGYSGEAVGVPHLHFATERGDPKSWIR
jgi:murein DD-endopeptidase MepM/ murein hydrolase activator NlpD